MLQEAIYKFKASGPMLLPELIDNYWIGEIKAYEDYAILPYEVHIPQPIDKVIDMFEMNADLAILYHLEPSVHTVFGHECCAYCYPVTERMFKINCKTSADGLVHELNVTIYNSIELMSADLFEDLRLHERRGTFRAKREHVQIMNDFNCLMTSSLPFISTYFGSKWFSISTPNFDFGKSRICPIEAMTSKSFPKYF